MNEDFRHYFFLVACQVIRIFMAAAGMALLARLLGPEGLGHWTMITAAATIVHLIFINWIQQDPLLRFGKEEWVKTGKVGNAWNARMPILIGGFVFSILLFIFVPQAWMKHLFELSVFDGFLAAVFFISLAMSIETQTLLQIVGSMNRLAYVPVLVSGGSALFYFVLFMGGFKSNAVTVSLLGTSLITLVIWGVFGIQEFKVAGLSFSMSDSSLMKEMIRFAWPILPATILGYLMSWGNQVIIQRFFTSKDVGFYQTAFQVHSVIVTASVPFTTVILPRIIGKSVNDPSIMRRYVQTIIPTIFSLWCFAVIPLIVVLPALFVMVFGASFLPSVSLLKVFLISTPLCALGQIYTVLYSVQKKMEKILIILGITVTCNLIGTWIALPEKGIFGVATVYTLIFIFSQSLMFGLQHQHLKESASKILPLFFLVMFFSVGQFVIDGLFYRLAWGIFVVMLFVLVIRKMKLVEGDLLKRLFVGSSDVIGKTLMKILVPTHARTGTL